MILATPLAPGASSSIRMQLAFIRATRNLPAKISNQGADHLVLFEINEYFYSPYETKSQSLKVLLWI